jgi:hypothetical protein
MRKEYQQPILNLNLNLNLNLILVAGMLVGSAASYAAESSGSGWEFELAPMFLWGMSIDGTSEVGPVELPLNIDFTDGVLENLAAVFTLHFEAKKKDLTLFTEIQYADLTPSAEIRGGPTVDVEFQNTLFELGAAYRVGTTGSTDWEVLGGARYTDQAISATIEESGVTVMDVDEGWWDGFVGGRVITRLSPKWTLMGRADIGAGGSDLVWNIAGFADYRFNDWGSVFAGWKWLDYDYESGSGLDRYGYDALQQGPLAGLTIHW